MYVQVFLKTTFCQLKNNCVCAGISEPFCQLKNKFLENLLINAIDGVQSKEFYVLKMDKMLTLHTNSRR